MSIEIGQTPASGDKPEVKQAFYKGYPVVFAPVGPQDGPGRDYPIILLGASHVPVAQEPVPPQAQDAEGGTVH